MNQKFLSKMIRAKRLEYEAFRELIPEEVNLKLDHLGQQMKKTMKECLIDFYCSWNSDSERTTKNEESNVSPKSKQQVKKVTIE